MRVKGFVKGVKRFDGRSTANVFFGLELVE